VGSKYQYADEVQMLVRHITEPVYVSPKYIMIHYGDKSNKINAYSPYSLNMADNLLIDYKTIT
jgi:hypothetical protein